MAGLSKSALAKMPLAEAVLQLFSYVCREDKLKELWESHRGRCYEKTISFPLMVQLISDALLQHEGSGRASFEASIDKGDLTATLQAAYKKLGRLPIELSMAFLAESTATLNAVFPPWAHWLPPKSLRSMRIKILDGKAIKRVAKRLKLLQGAAGGLLGGRALVALDWQTGMVAGFHAHPDGEANDVRFVPDLLPAVRKNWPDELRLWVGDSAFCDLKQPARFTEVAGDHFIVRYHKKVSIEVDPSRKEQHGTDEEGRAFVESWGSMGRKTNKNHRYVRVIRLSRPDAKDLVLVTDLLDAEKFPADDLLWVYRERWGIELTFQKVTDVFGLKGLIGGTPEACIFQFSFCLLLYNIMQTIRGFVAEQNDREPDEISTQKLFRTVKKQLIAWNVLLDPAETVVHFNKIQFENEGSLADQLRKLLASAWSNTWRKSPPQAVHNKTKRKRTRSHNSVYRILNKIKKE